MRGLLLLLPALCCAEELGAQEPQTPPAAPGYPVHGSLELRYRARWSDVDSDQDLLALLDLELGDPAHDQLTASVSAEALQDIDGVGQGSSTFFSLEDTRGGAFDTHVYHAYADWHGASGWETLRAGRQTIVETPEIAWFDGLRAETAESGALRAQFGAYGGLPVRLYSSVSQGDALYGGFAQLRPWTGARVRADWMHAQDDERLGGASNDVVAIGLWQTLWTSLRLDGAYSRLDDRDRDLRLHASWSASDSDLVLRASWYHLLEPQGELAQTFDPFSATLHDLEPYQQFGLQLSKSLSRELQLQAGYDARRVDRAQDQGAYNHDFDRGYATLIATDVLPASLVLSLTGEAWYSTPSDFRTLGGELSRRFDERLDAALGTLYSLYQYDLYQARETDHVRTWYTKLVFDRNAPLRLELRYQIEENPIDQYQDLRLGVTWRF